MTGRGGSPVADESAALTALASAVAQEAAALLLTRHGQVGVLQTKSSPTDVVTEMDQAAERLIRERLLAARPGDSVLGEEGGQTGAGAFLSSGRASVHCVLLR